MSKRRKLNIRLVRSKIGAVVMYCGHRAWFKADVFEVGNCCVVRANGPLTKESGNLQFNAGFAEGYPAGVTHHVVDYPDHGFWRPDIGVLVVPKEQVHVVQDGEIVQ